MNGIIKTIDEKITSQEDTIKYLRRKNEELEKENSELRNKNIELARELQSKAVESAGVE